MNPDKLKRATALDKYDILDLQGNQKREIIEKYETSLKTLKIYLGRERNIFDAIEAKPKEKQEEAYKRSLETGYFYEPGNAAWIQGGIDGGNRFKLKTPLSDSVKEIIKSIREDNSINFPKEPISLKEFVEKLKNNPNELENMNFNENTPNDTDKEKEFLKRLIGLKDLSENQQLFRPPLKDPNSKDRFLTFFAKELAYLVGTPQYGFEEVPKKNQQKHPGQTKQQFVKVI